MLEFFRKYQRYFFVVITVVIIVSFSFFGTYSTLTANSMREQIAFTAIDGTPVKRADLDDLVLFLGTDTEDKVAFGGIWGPNFLNDGVLKKDFLETGLGEALAVQYAKDIMPDLQMRLAKEKRFSEYTHPQARFLSASTAWNYFAPDLKTNYEALRQSEDPVEKEALESRISLYLAEKQFPASLLRRVLQYQEKQFTWLAPDPNLAQSDLSLFGYHTLEDWFGPRLVRLMAEFIINSAKIAEEKGYQVTKAEALADLMRNSEISYQQQKNNPHLGVANGSEYFQEQLRRMGMDQSKASTVWKQVLLFRRLYHDMGDSVFIDPQTFKPFEAYAKEAIVGDLYHLPEALQLGNYRSLQKFELYLNAVSKRDDQDLLKLPTTFLTAEEVSKKYPELVERRYLVEVAQAEIKTLGAKVGIKEMWDWEVQDSNWEMLKKQFPELGIKKAGTREERFAALDALDEKTRDRLDAQARSAIVESHPEWIDQALKSAEKKKLITGIQLKGGSSLFSGVENRDQLIQKLDQAPLAQDPSGELAHYSGDQKMYYWVKVLDRDPKLEVLTFAEATDNGTLDQLLDKQLEAYYQQIRDVYPKEFQNEDGSWRPYADVKDDVADHYFTKILNAIRAEYTASSESKLEQSQLNGDQSAPVRFYSHVKKIEADLEKKSAGAAAWINDPLQAQAGEDKLPVRESLTVQWKLIKDAYRTDRADETASTKDAFDMAENAWSKVYTPPNGDLYFFQIKGKDSSGEAPAIAEQTMQAYRMLSNDAQRVLAERLLQKMQEKGALSVDYLNQQQESPVEE